ncbi:MAG: hypothetical protein ACR5KW_02890 [Wolbachia sp.]
MAKIINLLYQKSNLLKKDKPLTVLEQRVNRVKQERSFQKQEDERRKEVENQDQYR